MKNLILSVGMAILLMMGLLFQADCTDIIRLERKLKWIGEEIAEMAAERMWGGEEESTEENKEEKTEENVENQIKRMADLILKENLNLDETLTPADKSGILQGQIRLFVAYAYPCVTVSLNGGEVKTRLPFLSEEREVKKTVSCVWTE